MIAVDRDYDPAESEYTEEEIANCLENLPIGRKAGKIECSKCGEVINLRERLDNGEGYPHLTGYTRERVPTFRRGKFEVEEIYCPNHQDDTFRWNDFEDWTEAYFECGVFWHGEGFKPTVLLPEVNKIR